MTLFAVTITGVSPKQCIVVWDRETSAKALADHLNKTVSDNVRVERVSSFFPSDMCEADQAWLVATDSYLRGDHLNTSGDPA